MHGMENVKHFNFHLQCVGCIRLFCSLYFFYLSPPYLCLPFCRLYPLLPFFSFPLLLSLLLNTDLLQAYTQNKSQILHNEEVSIEKIFVSQLLPLHIPPVNHLYSNAAVNTLFYEEYVLGLSY